MKTNKESIQELEDKIIERAYVSQKTSSTYNLKKEKIYIVSIASVNSEGDIASLNAWFIATGRNTQNTGVVQRIVGNNYSCELNNFNLTVSHNYNSLVAITEM